MKKRDDPRSYDTILLWLDAKNSERAAKQANKERGLPALTYRYSDNYARRGGKR